MEFIKLFIMLSCVYDIQQLTTYISRAVAVPC